MVLHTNQRSSDQSIVAVSYMSKQSFNNTSTITDNRMKDSAINLTVTGDQATLKVGQSQQAEIIRRSRKLFKFLLTLLAFDVFSADKQDEKNSQTTYSSLMHNRAHWMLRCWNKISLPIYVYLALRPTVTFTLRVLIHQLGSGGDPRSAQFLLAQKLRWMLLVSGDPFCTIGRLTPIVYLGTPIAVIIILCALPYYFRNIRPFDCSLARLLLDPKREVRRIDRLTDDCLHFALEAVKGQQRELSSLLQVSLNFHTPIERRTKLHEHIEIGDYFEALVGQSNLLRHFRRNLTTIRPKTFRADWIQHYHRCFLLIFTSCVVGLSIMSQTNTLVFFYIVWHDRCQFVSNITQPADCRLLTLFTLSEVLMPIEIYTSLETLIIPACSFLLVMIVLLVRNEMDMIECTRENLVRLSAKLSQVELLQLERNEQVEMETATLTSAESVMYENIIGLWTFKAESRRNITLIGRLMGFCLVVLFLLTVASFGTFVPSMAASLVVCQASQPINETSSDPQGNLADLVAVGIFLLVWVNANITMLTCAIIPSRVSHMKRLLVSISAQTIRINHNQTDSPSRREQLWMGTNLSLRVDEGKRQMDADSPILLLWRKIVLSNCFSDEDHSVTVFNFKLTYKKALELNFYIAALLSLMNTKR